MPGLRRKNGDRTEIAGLVYLQPHLIELLSAGRLRSQKLFNCSIKTAGVIELQKNDCKPQPTIALPASCLNFSSIKFGGSRFFFHESANRDKRRSRKLERGARKFESTVLFAHIADSLAPKTNDSSYRSKRY
ncbi:hypothetical protein SDJN02_20886, partial [Cucurbita argyrosperma subsp. argyrosperma]